MQWKQLAKLKCTTQVISLDSWKHTFQTNRKNGVALHHRFSEKHSLGFKFIVFPFPWLIASQKDKEPKMPGY